MVQQHREEIETAMKWKHLFYIANYDMLMKKRNTLHLFLHILMITVCIAGWSMFSHVFGEANLDYLYGNASDNVIVANYYEYEGVDPDEWIDSNLSYALSLEHTGEPVYYANVYIPAYMNREDWWFANMKYMTLEMTLLAGFMAGGIGKLLLYLITEGISQSVNVKLTLSVADALGICLRTDAVLIGITVLMEILLFLTILRESPNRLMTEQG